MNRNSPASIDADKAEIAALQADVIELTTENGDLRNGLGRAKIWLGLLATTLAVLVVFVVVGSIDRTNLANELRHQRDVTNEYMFDNLILQKQLRVYNLERAAEAEARENRLHDALNECREQVRASMADVTVDAFGNPVDVSSFAEQSCDDELKRSREQEFVERFTPSS